jgi:hypothetical protein
MQMFVPLGLGRELQRAEGGEGTAFRKGERLENLVVGLEF